MGWLAVIVALFVFCILMLILTLFVSRRQSPDIRPMWYRAPNQMHPSQVTPIGDYPSHHGYWSEHYGRRIFYVAHELHKEKQG